MARIILWLFVIVGLLATIINFINGNSITVDMKYMVMGSLFALAIAEAIEQAGKKK